MFRYTEYSITFPIPYLLEIHNGAVRMSQKNENNSTESNSRNSSSEESGDKKGRTTAHQKITLPIFEKERYKKQNYGGDDLPSMSK